MTRKEVFYGILNCCVWVFIIGGDLAIWIIVVAAILKIFGK